MPKKNEKNLQNRRRNIARSNFFAEFNSLQFYISDIVFEGGRKAGHWFPKTKKEWKPDRASILFTYISFTFGSFRVSSETVKVILRYSPLMLS